MSRIGDALARLDAAIARVEKVTAQPKPTGTDLELASELRHARQDYETLRERTDNVAERLDTAIGRLNGILGDAAE